MNATNPTSSQGAHMQRWKAKFGLNMIVMAVCFALYYLGLFGGVEGPLTVANIGRCLAEAGLTSDHFQILLLAVFVAALCWNWAVNLLAHATGQRLTCSAGSPGQGFCGESVERMRKTGGDGWEYVCPKGHRRAAAHFHPVTKGTAANTVLLISLVCCLMYYFID